MCPEFAGTSQSVVAFAIKWDFDDDDDDYGGDDNNADNDDDALNLELHPHLQGDQ